MGTPLGDFLRARRDATSPEQVGLPRGSRRRAPGLRRTEVAELAGISVEYLVRIEQGRDRNPSPAVVAALGDALRLDAAERQHLRHLTKITGATCIGPRARPGRSVRPGVQRLLEQLEPGFAAVTNRLGELVAYTSGFEALARAAGFLSPGVSNLTRFVFADPRARAVFPDWEQVADEQAFALSCSPLDDEAAALRAELTAAAGSAFANRLGGALLPPQKGWRLMLPSLGETRWDRESLELSPADAQQLLVLLPADRATEEVVDRLLGAGGAALRVVG